MDHSEPPSWVRETFGALAEQLARVVPQAIRAAHERAMGSHLGGDMRSADAYVLTVTNIASDQAVQNASCIELRFGNDYCHIVRKFESCGAHRG